MPEIEDGGPAFPHGEIHDGHEQPTGGYRHLLASTGMSKRELFAAILMHSEAVTCGVPGEAREALVEASRVAGTDVIDHMAMNAVQGADALLRALAEPKQPEPRFDYDASAASTSEKEAIKRLATASFFDDLPQDTRDFVRHAVHRIDMDENDIPF
jgi:hypothetical protein